MCCVFVQAEDGIRDLVRSRGLGDVYKRQLDPFINFDGAKARQRIVLDLMVRRDLLAAAEAERIFAEPIILAADPNRQPALCLLYTSDAADERSSVDLGGRRIIKKKNNRRSDSTPTHRSTRRATQQQMQQTYSTKTYTNTRA
mgnify:CR=1 FL=1